MNAAHLHLVINHFPVVGFILTFFMLLYALKVDVEQVSRLILAMVFIFGIFSAMAFYTGEPAEDVIEQVPGVSEESIEAHEDKAKIAFVSAVVTSVCGIGTLLLGLKHCRTSRVGLRVTTGLNLLTVLLMLWTANLGGKIRHSEIHAKRANFLIYCGNG